MVIYYEDIGTVHIQTGRLRFIQIITRAEIKKDQEFLGQIIGNMSKLYGSYYMEEVYERMVNLEAETTKSLIREVEHIEDSPQTKRYLFGKVLQFIFGLNDEVFDDIKELGEHEDQIVQN